LNSGWPTLPASTPAALFALSLVGEDINSSKYARNRAFVLERAPSEYRKGTDDEFVELGQGNLYFWYYGTLSMFRAGGDAWQRWNVAMKDHAAARPAGRRLLAGDRHLLPLRARQSPRPVLQHGDVRALARGLLPLLPAFAEGSLNMPGRVVTSRKRPPSPSSTAGAGPSHRLPRPNPLPWIANRTEDVMTDRTQELLTRIESLERKNRRIVGAGAAVLALGAIGLVSARTVCDTVTAERFVLRDAQGQQRGVFTPTRPAARRSSRCSTRRASRWPSSPSRRTARS
jgi:hypothetical protein